MTTKQQALEALKPCPFCGTRPVKGLTKKTGCQMHGDPIQHATIGCTKCEFRPHCTGGDIYRGSETPKYKEEAYAEAAKKWNTRAFIEQSPEVIKSIVVDREGALEVIIPVLNEARCNTDRVIGNRELGQRLVSALCNSGLIIEKEKT
jgi:hypothetical protein